MKTIVFLMLAVCVGCSGQANKILVGVGPDGRVSSAQVQENLSPGYLSIAPTTTWTQPDRFANCVTFEGIHYCPEGRYIQVQDDAKRPDPYGICAAYPMLDGCKVPDFKQNQSLVCPSYTYRGTTTPNQPGSITGTIPFGSELDINPQIKDDDSHLDLHNCPLGAQGSFNCTPVAPTTKEAQREPSCSLWGLRSDDAELELYCGDHVATTDEIVNAPDLEGDKNIFKEGDKDIPKHKSSEAKPKEREFYPPDPDKGPQLLKASLRIQ